MAYSTAGMREVTFVTADGDLMIRMQRGDMNSICTAAQQLKASFFVVSEDHDMVADMPIWSVYTMRNADPNGGGPRQWAVRDPIRRFTSETADPAVMFAIARRGQ